MKHELDVIVISQIVVVVSETVLDFSSLSLVQESGGFRVIGKSPESDDGNDDSQETLEDEDPCPSRSTANHVHLVDAAGKKTAKRSSNCRG